MDFSYVHIRYFIGYVYHICLQDTIQSTQSLCLMCKAMLLPMPLPPLLLTTRSGFTATHVVSCSSFVYRIPCILILSLQRHGLSKRAQGLALRVVLGLDVEIALVGRCNM